MERHFEWDPAKDVVNRRKHGVSFDAVREVFSDPLAMMKQDRVEGGEQRWQTTGMALGLQLIVVAHTFADDDGVEIVRIISARRATKSERRKYEQDA